MSGDDELRRRLRDIPAPRAGLDADAVIARAKRKRRPKTIALSSAATVAGVLIVAPLVVPGLQVLPQFASTVSTDAGGAATDSATEPAPGAESGASPESATGAEEDGAEEDGAESAGTDETGATDAGEGDTGASGGEGGPAPANGAALAAACAPAAAGDAGLALRFLDDPADGSADLAVQNLTAGRIEVRLDDVGSVEVDADGRIVAAGVWPGTWSRSQVAAGAGGDGGVTVDLVPRTPCSDSAGSAAGGPGIAPVATAHVTRGDETTVLTVVGEPFDVR